MPKKLHISSLALLGLLSTASAQAMELASYRALYTIEPARVDKAKGSIPLDGRLAMEVKGTACTGYTVDMRFATRFASGEREARTVVSESSTHETADSRSLRVSQQQYVNQKLSDDSQITAERGDSHSAATVHQTGSLASDFSTEKDVLFPTQHQSKLLALAASGQTRDVSLLFDGSDGKKQFRVVSFIGKRRAPGSWAPDLVPAYLSELKSQASWPYQLGYYPLTGTDESPEFQATFNMYENGVTTEMLFDYGTYAVRGRIASLEYLPQPKCDDAPKPKL